MNVEGLRQFSNRVLAPDGGQRRLRLECRRLVPARRLLIVSPETSGTACPLSGRNSTYRPVQIFEASSLLETSPDGAAPRRSGIHLSNPSGMTTAQPAAATCKRIGRNASVSHRHSGHDDRDFVQHKFLHGSFTFLLR
jgi:hypothetical protein